MSELTREYLQRRVDEANAAYDQACWALHGAAHVVVVAAPGGDAAARLRRNVEAADEARRVANEAVKARDAFRAETRFEAVQ